MVSLKIYLTSVDESLVGDVGISVFSTSDESFFLEVSMTRHFNMSTTISCIYCPDYYKEKEIF